MHSSIFHENKFITGFREKTELNNSSFASQCSLIKNTSVLPTNHESLTDKSLSSITFGDNYSGKIIKGLDPNKTYGHDMISIPMLKFCGGPNCKPLWLTFRACFDQRLCPFAGKKNIVTIPKTVNKEL